MSLFLVFATPHTQTPSCIFQDDDSLNDGDSGHMAMGGLPPGFSGHHSLPLGSMTAGGSGGMSGHHSLGGHGSAMLSKKVRPQCHCNEECFESGQVGSSPFRFPTCSHPQRVLTNERTITNWNGSGVIISRTAFPSSAIPYPPWAATRFA